MNFHSIDMELKVWVDGFQRIVCGVTDNTTCQDVVYALAHATGKIGRFTLIERWRCNERHLAPHENPLKILMKWGEYSSDVQFILQRSDAPKQIQSPQQIQRQQQRTQHTITSNNNPSTELDISETADISIDRHKNVRKSFTFGHLVSDVRLADKVGIVRGVPQIKPAAENKDIISEQISGVHNTVTQDPDEIFLAHIKLLDNHRKSSPAYREPICSLVPPPYRDPPPPTNQVKVSLTAASESPNKKKIQTDYSQINGLSEINESLLYNVQYRDLISLVKCQQEKLNSQQSDLNKYDADIEYLESKTREQQEQLDVLSREILQADMALRQGSEQLQALSYVEEENEIIKQQEKILKSELTLLRSKLANCETELLQCKNKIRLLLDELQIEQKAHIWQYDNRQQLELCLLTEVEHLQLDIEHAKVTTDDATQTADVLKMEVIELEAAIIEKKRQVERLVGEMKEVNLQSLTNSTIAEEVKFLLEGSHKPGSTRRMIGSPRQLENAVPTNKNPHGVWV